ncbi:MAG TPA: hypothetical protein VHY91_16475 [Pirellulales bacterium]|jgi:hypothetical protein|nr:hypothetical protein [Pirellulales bacterium]
MRIHFLAIALCASGFLSSAGALLAQDASRDYAFGIRDAAAKADDDAYYFYTGEMYRSHAYDNADVLTQYAALNRPIPVPVIEEHTAAIRNNLVASNKAYSKLTKQFKDNPEAEKHLARMHEHQKNALTALDKLDAAAKSGKAEPKTINADAKAVQTELAAASGEHQRFLQKAGKAPVASK